MHTENADHIVEPRGQGKEGCVCVCVCVCVSVCVCVTKEQTNEAGQQNMGVQHCETFLRVKKQRASRNATMLYKGFLYVEGDLRSFGATVIVKRNENSEYNTGLKCPNSRKLTDRIIDDQYW